MKRIGFYPGSFDPVTLGHADVIARACRLLDKLVIGIGAHDTKKPMFSAQERTAMLEAETKPIAASTGTEIGIVTFDGLVVDAAREHRAGVIVRGLRDATDFDYEMQMALMNRHLDATLETVFMVPSLDTTYISSSLVKQVAQFHGDVTGLVPPPVATALRAKFPPDRA